MARKLQLLSMQGDPIVKGQIMLKQSIRQMKSLVAAVTLAGTCALGVAHADQLFVQMSGTAPAGGDPNVITNTGGFVIGAAGGNFTLQNPLLVVVGVYNGMGTPSLSFSSTGCTPSCSLAAVGTYGLTGNTATLTSGQNVWDQLGLTGGGSESYTNWAGYDQNTLGLSPTSFSLYAFAIDTSLTSGTPITVSESGAANGSFIAAYGCQVASGPNIYGRRRNNDNNNGGGCSEGNVAQTVFTNTGVINGSVPEPGALALMAAGLLGLGWFVRRRRLD